MALEKLRRCLVQSLHGSLDQLSGILLQLLFRSGQDLLKNGDKLRRELLDSRLAMVIYEKTR